MFGARGLSQYYPLNNSVFVQALEVLLNLVQKFGAEPSVEMMSNMLSQVCIIFL